jgi:hypothetical protein
MSFDDLGALGELIGGVASVILLVYIAYQIRQNSRLIEHNTRATEASTRQAFGAQDQAYLGSEIDPSVVAQAVAKLGTGEPLSDLEHSQLVARQHLNFRIFENAFYQFQKGVLDQSEWDRYERIIAFLFKRPDYREHVHRMWEGLEGAFAPAFAAEVARIRAKSGETQ